jgi:hypothetical protein
MMRSLTLLAALSLSACSTYQATVDSLDSPQQPKPPHVDLSNAAWQKLAADQPDTNPLRVAIVERNQTAGITRVVIKAPAAFTLPPYWLTVEGNYTVLKGTFLFDTITSKGIREKRAQGPGTFVKVQPQYILQATTRPGTEALLYMTVYGEWAPKFAEGAWTRQTANAN